MREADLQKQTLEWFSLQRDCFAIRINTQGVPLHGREGYRPSPMRGVADILACIKGRFLAIELKSDRGRLSEDPRRDHSDGRAHPRNNPTLRSGPCQLSLMTIQSADGSTHGSVPITRTPITKDLIRSSECFRERMRKKPGSDSWNSGRSGSNSLL